jgi:hypothetical protein
MSTSCARYFIRYDARCRNTDGGHVKRCFDTLAKKVVYHGNARQSKNGSGQKVVQVLVTSPRF